jgi:hypothetical protein
MTTLPLVRTPPSDPDHDRSDDALRAFADYVLEAAASARREANPITGESYVVVRLGAGDDVTPWRWPADTLDEIGRVLGALPQIRGTR